MLINNKKYYVLFGNPVQHSKSPTIHDLFAEQTNCLMRYNTQYVEKDKFFTAFLYFLKSHYSGANITVPFKHDAYLLSHVLTKRALISGSVNTIKKISSGKILGDNTDGIGLLYDLKRLNAINYSDRVLLIGSGGAARGIIPNLLSLNCSIDVVNRTFCNAKKIVYFFKNLGSIRAINVSLLKELNYDLVINATSVGIKNNSNFFISNLVFYPKNTFFYDLYYSNELTPFLRWCKINKAIYFSDGIGMLVSQAAYSFYLWNGIFPNVKNVISFLNHQKKYVYL
ncbi:shikimate dehydrogenase [Buchnera aphidicola]|uniref:shikimate dehydrogenase n=1 Tax=Buchnera aphidicola TaxID=9 RepID=UPI0034643502